MFTITEMSRSAQRTVCMVLAGFIVSASLAIGAFGVEKPLHPGYVVTVTQLS
jgi:hypothetical protein